MRLSSAPLVALALLLGACAPSGDDPRNRRIAVSPPGGEFTVYALAPPWEVVEVADGRVQLFIESSRQAILDAGPSKFDLFATVVRGDLTARIQTEETQLRNGGNVIDVGPRAVATDQGLEGLEVLATTPERLQRRIRVVLLAFGAGDDRLLRLEFVAVPALDTLEVEAMIRQVEVAP
jgi:hypothetical protein